MADVGSVFIRVNADTAGITAGMQRATASVTGFTQAGERRLDQFARSSHRSLSMVGDDLAHLASLGRTFGSSLVAGMAGIGISGIIKSVRGLVKEIATIGDEAARAGVSVTVFQEWRAVAEATRIPVAALSDAFKELSIRAIEFVQTGKGSAAEVFGQLGMSREDIKARLENPSELMLEILNRTRQLKSAAGANRVFDEAFGGQGAEQLIRLLKLSNDEIRGIIVSAQDAGAIFDEKMIAKADAFDRKWNAAWSNFSLGARGMVMDIIDYLSQLERKFNEVGNSDFFLWLAGKIHDSGLADPSIKLDLGKVEAANDRLDVAALEREVTAGTTGGGGFSALAGMASAAFGGFSTGYQSGNAGMGLLGGAMQGWGAGSSMAALFPAMATALPVIGAIVGGCGGKIGRIFKEREAA